MFTANTKKLGGGEVAACVERYEGHNPKKILRSRLKTKQGQKFLYLYHDSITSTGAKPA